MTLDTPFVGSPPQRLAHLIRIRWRRPRNPQAFQCSNDPGPTQGLTTVNTQLLDRSSFVAAINDPAYIKVVPVSPQFLYSFRTSFHKDLNRTPTYTTVSISLIADPCKTCAR
jgi:hypothetical protein